MLTLLGMSQNCSKHNVDYVTNKIHEGQTIRMSVAAHLPVPSQVLHLNTYSLSCSFKSPAMHIDSKGTWRYFLRAYSILLLWAE